MPFFDTASKEGNPSAGTPLRTPPVDMVHGDEGLRVRVDAPGVRARDVEVDINGAVLTISESSAEGWAGLVQRYSLRRARQEAYLRSVPLPCAVVEKDFESRVTGGVIEVIIPSSAFGNDQSGSNDDPQIAILDELRAETRELLQAMKEAPPAIRRLALSSAPFGVRSELIAHGLSEDVVPGSSGLVLTTLGEAVLETVEPLGDRERERLAQRADEVIDDISAAEEVSAENA